LFDEENMKRVCPNPQYWNEACEKLHDYSRKHRCEPPTPPIPLVLSGWAMSSDVEKIQRWQETVRWATINGCLDLLSAIQETDYYYVEDL
jgi:hypothetical protein